MHRRLIRAVPPEAVPDFFDNLSKITEAMNALRRERQENPYHRQEEAMNNPRPLFFFAAALLLLLAKANPITYVSKETPPFLLIHGDQDPVVPPHQAELLRDALKKTGVEVQLHLVKGAGHGVGGKEVNDLIDAFFDKRLKNARKQKTPEVPEEKRGKPGNEHSQGAASSRA